MKETGQPRSTPISRAKPGAIGCEDDRCEFLHRLCEFIETRIREGAPVMAAFRQAAKHQRKRLFKHGSLSPARITSLFYIWRKTRSPEVFRRHYIPGKPRIPLALVLEFLNRLASDRIVPGAAVIHSLRADWRLGRSIPGLGTWRDHLRRLHGESSSRINPPRFPFATKTLIRYLAAGKPGDWQRRIIAALRAQRELARFLEFIEARRTALESRRAHESLGGFSQQQ